ncbi:Protein FAR-RED IMPAIRED RESPONSE 1 [Bienertia sinuspersici]
MECAEGVGRDDAVDDVIDGNECDEVYDVGSYAATGAGLEELDVEQCAGESNIAISRGSVSGFIIGDDATQREDVSDTRNVNGVVTPAVGSVYNSWEEVERMFKGQSAYYGGTKNRRAMTMRCECYGCPDMKIKNDEKKRQKDMEIGGYSGEELILRRRRKVRASLNRDHLWEIRKVTLEHSGHNPEPGQAKLVKWYRMKHFTTSMRSRVFNDIDAGVPLANIHGSNARERDGLQNMPIIEDMRHVVDERRRLKMEGGDAKALLKNFDHDKGTLKDLFWADARSRAAYEEFGDVVCFDSTYLTNKYHLPFVNFVAVNHHGQTVFFGYALVSVEDADTFEWVFRQWLKCMGGRAPDGLLTDQAAAMRQPIKNVFSETRHRWCIWHILRKLPRKLGRHENFTKEEFDSRWEEVTSDYGIVNDEWLSGLFVEMSMWVPAYLKDQFWAGMRTTQRVESINSFFDKFVTRLTRLCEFGEKYLAAVERRIMQEKEADEKGHKYTRNLLTGIPLEKYFQRMYTDAKFRAF